MKQKPILWIIGIIILSTNIHAFNLTLNTTTNFTVNIEYNQGYITQKYANYSDAPGTLSTGNYYNTSNSSITTGYIYINFSRPTWDTNPYINSYFAGSNLTFNTTYSLFGNTAANCLNRNTIELSYTQRNGTVPTEGFTCYNGTAYQLLYLASASYTSGTTNCNSARYYADGNVTSGTNWNGTAWCDGGSGGKGLNESWMYWYMPSYSESFSNNTSYISTNYVRQNVTANITYLADGYVPVTYSNVELDANLTGNITPTGINLSFYDENNGSLINGTAVTIYLSGADQSYNYTTTTGSRLLSGILNQTYTITYSASGYSPRTYIFEMVSGNEKLNLYLLNDSVDTIVLATVTDTFGKKVQGVDIQLQKKNLSGTNYYIVESCLTNALGNCLLHVYLYDTTYKFQLYLNDELKLDSQDTKIVDSIITFTIVTSANSISTIYDQQASTGNISYNNATSTFSFTFNDTRDAFTTICLKTEYTTGITTTPYQSNCSTSNTSTITLTIDQNVGDEWTATGYGVITSTSNYVIDTLSFVVSQWKARFGKEGLYLFGFFVIGVAAFSGLIHPIIPPVFIGITTWVFNSLGFIGVGASAVISVVCIIMFIIVVNKKT